MKRVVTRMALTLIVVGISCVGFAARACTCNAQRSPYQEYQKSKSVFIGKVVGSKDIAVTEQLGDKTFIATERVFQFTVSESLKGSRLLWTAAAAPAL